MSWSVWSVSSPGIGSQTSALPKGFCVCWDMKAIHGSKTKNDRIDSKKIAKLLRAGMIPMAYVYPKAMRSTRDLLRRRLQFGHQRSNLLIHMQQTNDQYNVSKIGKTLKYKGNREGIVDRFPDHSVQKTITVDLELIAYDDRVLRKLEWHILKTAKAHDATALHILRALPGIGKIFSLVLLYEVQDIRRFSRPQQLASYARLIRPVKESGGKRTGSSNAKIGNAYVKWAFSEAVVVFLREPRDAQPYIRRLERKDGKDNATGILAHRLGRTVYYRLTRKQLCDINKFVNQQQAVNSKEPGARQQGSREQGMSGKYEAGTGCSFPAPARVGRDHGRRRRQLG